MSIWVVDAGSIVIDVSDAAGAVSEPSVAAVALPSPTADAAEIASDPSAAPASASLRRNHISGWATTEADATRFVRTGWCVPTVEVAVADVTLVFDTARRVSATSEAAAERDTDTSLDSDAPPPEVPRMIGKPPLGVTLATAFRTMLVRRFTASTVAVTTAAAIRPRATRLEEVADVETDELLVIETVFFELTLREASADRTAVTVLVSEAPPPEVPRMNGKPPVDVTLATADKVFVITPTAVVTVAVSETDAMKVSSFERSSDAPEVTEATFDVIT